jgi:spermidine synthase
LKAVVLPRPKNDRSGLRHDKSNRASKIADRELPTQKSREPEASVLAVLVLMSGCAALAMQVAWMRELRLVFGATTSAVAAVLAIFMGGVGLGSLWLGLRAERSRNPLAMYGWLEIGIAASAAVSPFLIVLIANIYWGLGGQTILGDFGATLTRLLLAAIVLGVPTFLMGGTLPAIVRAVTGVSDRRRSGLGLLYGANTIGAVLGSTAATFFTLEILGTRATLWFGASIGMLAGILAVIKSRQIDELPTDSDATTKATLEESHREQAQPWLIYSAAGVVGFAFFALELVWYRLLAPILGGTTYTFGLILSLALLGIGLGGLLYPVLSRWVRPTLGLLAITCGLEALFAMVPFAIGDRLAIWAAWESQNAKTFGSLVWGWIQIAGVVVFPVALISGLQFPLLIALLGHGRKGVSQHVGTAYAWNTLGAIGGSLVGGFGALPILGAVGLWHGVSWLLLGLSALILMLGNERRLPQLAIGIVVVLATLGCQWALGPTAVWRHSAIGARRAVIPENNANLVQQWSNYQRRSLVWETDGRECGLGLVAQDGLSFVVNGKSDGNALADAPTQMGMAILGAVLHPDPRKGLVVGLGTGETVGWLADMRNIERVDAVEIEPAIDEMARWCSGVNREVMDHPKVQRLYNDAREYLLTTREVYDVIASAPSNPYRAGIANLYTEEFYHAAANRLNDEGVFVQFLQAYEVDLETIETVLTTISSVFAQVEIWQTSASDMQLVCFKNRVVHDTDKISQRLSCPVVQEAMQLGWRVNDITGFFAHYTIAPQFTDGFRKRPREFRNTDDCNVLEYRFAKTVGVPDLFSMESLRASVATKGQHRPETTGEGLDWQAIELRRQTLSILHRGPLSMALLPKEEDRKLVSALHEYRNGRYTTALEQWPEVYCGTSDTLLSLMYAHCLAELGDHRFLEQPALEGGRWDAEVAALNVIYHFRLGRPEVASNYLMALIQHLKKSPWVLNLMVEPALDLAIEIAEKSPEESRVWQSLLQERFAEWRFEGRRLLMRVFAAHAMQSSDLIDAVIACEPNPDWEREFLEIRERIYSDVGHLRSGRARKDLEIFRQHEQHR